MTTEKCREILRRYANRAYALNVKNPDCGFVIVVYSPKYTQNAGHRFKTLTDCIAEVWPHYHWRYIGNYKRVIYVLGISLEEFKKQAGI